jgi:AraC-like DNA-binding protein
MPATQDPTLLHVGRIFPMRGWHMPLHVHPRHNELIVVLAGQIEAQLAGRRIVGKPGDVLFYPQGVPHIEEALGVMALETIFVAWRAPDPRWTAGWPLLRSDTRGRMRMIATWMFEDRPLAGQGKPATAAAPRTTPLMQHLLTALLHAYAHQPDAGGSDAMVDRVKRYVHEHLTQPLSLESLSEVACVSPFHFARRFRASTGMPPMRFVREARLDAARTLLLTTNLPHRLVAQRVGLSSQSHLARCFRRATGQAPSTLRRTGTRSSP